MWNSVTVHTIAASNSLAPAEQQGAFITSTFTCDHHLLGEKARMGYTIISISYLRMFVYNIRYLYNRGNYLTISHDVSCNGYECL